MQKLSTILKRNNNWAGRISCLYLIFFLSCSTQDDSRLTEAGVNWPVYLGGKSSSQYSPLHQINKGNIKSLDVAWEYHTGEDVKENHSQIQCNPIIIDGILYGTSPKIKVFALNATSGELKWEFDPNPEGEALNVNRGLSYWENDSDKRLLFTSGPDLFALNAETGELIKSFGNSGKVSLKEGLGEQSEKLYVVATSPGIVYHDLLIIGSRVSEQAGGAPGFIRAFNIMTGSLAWTFHTIPRPGEFGYDTWPEGAFQKAGGANCWAGMSLDEKRGIVFIPTGSAAFDFWGGNRKGANLFANCVLALDALTGTRIWHYQTVHHDLWDRDLPAPPNLVTVSRNGKKVDAIAQITKSGFVFVFERETGKNLFPVEERMVPSSDLEGEETWITQPIPLLPPPFCPQQLTADNLSTINSQYHDSLSKIFTRIRSGNLFIPPSTQGTLIFPGYDGGGEWGGAAVDPESSVLFVNSNVMPWILTMVKLEKEIPQAPNPGKMVYLASCAVCHGSQFEGNKSANYPSLMSLSEKFNNYEILKLINTGKGFMPSFNHFEEKDKAALVDFLLNPGESFLSNVKDTEERQNTHISEKENINDYVPYTHTGYNRFLDEDGFPAVQPPWGLISAIDLNNGTIKWQVPLGEFEELTQRGIPKTGTENYGGPVVTAGGLLFIGASKDKYFRAFDKDSGEELWKYKLPAGGYATPAVYEVDGKQYVVIACGGGKMGTPSGDSYMAFTLNPDKQNK